MRKLYWSPTALLLILLAGCTAGTALSPDQATGTAIVSGKYTQAAERTLHPPTPQPTEPPVEATVVWTPMANEIVASDSGKTYNIGITERISVILDEKQYPPSDLKEECEPAAVLGRISNIPVVPPGFYVVRYEGVGPGMCVIRDGAFEVTINVVN